MRDADAARADGLSTRAVHAGAPSPVPDAPVVQPVFQTTTFYTAAEPAAAVRYTRYGTNPNHEALGVKLAALEGGEAALVVASGNAAMMLALLTLVSAGDGVLAQRELYGGTLRLLLRELPRLGIETTLLPFDGDWAGGMTDRTRAVLTEVPINPTIRVPDLPAITAAAGARGIPVIVDATFATPINLRPLEHGATLVVHSATKYLGGHSDVTAGVIVGRADLVAEAREKLISFGPVLDPHAAWLLDRGVKTLAARMTVHNANGLAIARRLAAHTAIEHVDYPGLEMHADHERARTLLAGFGGMIGIVVRGGDAAAVRMLERLRLMRVAPSLGGVETLVSMPRYTSHAALPRAERHALGIADGYVRLSIGIEDADDLIRDLEAALDG
jgi:cystathionine beta-lyase/cystathionine gamma-synthase